MSYLIPQLITVAVYGLLFKEFIDRGGNSMGDYALSIPMITLMFTCPVWWAFYLIELVFYK